MDGEVIKEVRRSTPTTGSAGLYSQLPGQATTVDGIAMATGGLESGNIIETDNK